MANHASALKRQRQNDKRRTANRIRSSDLRTFLKKVRTAPSKEEALKILPQAVSRLHKAAQKGLLHRKNAGRKISRLTQFVSQLS